MASSERLGFIDALKAVGIFFVFLGHLEYTNESILIYINSFHMPLFFLVSGMFFSQKDSFTSYLRAKIHTRIVPYLTFGFITYSIWAIERAIGMGSVVDISFPVYRPLLGMLYGNGIDSYMIHNVLLWFLACLFVTEILFYFVHRVSSSRTVMILFIVVGTSVAGYLRSFSDFPRLPFSFDIAFIAVFFYGIGYCYREKLSSMRLNIIVTLCLFVVGVLFGMANELVDMNKNVYGNLLYFFPGALASIVFYMMLARYLQNIRVLTYIGRNTLPIFLLQVVAYKGIRLLLLLGNIHFDSPNFPVALIFATSAILILFPVVWCINRYFPFMLGRIPFYGPRSRA